MSSPLPAAIAHRMVDAMRAELPDLQFDLDEWTVRMMRWHFSDATGSPFWTKARDSLPFDPLRDIAGFEDLRRFGLFDKERLRQAPVRELLPRGYAGRPFRVFETGGSTGTPCRIVNVTRLDDDVVMYAAMLRERGLEGGDIVAMVPSGPHAYGHFVAGLADSWRGAVGTIDFDPRWVKEEIRAGASADGYLRHLVRQTISLLERRESTLLFTTTKLLLVLATFLDDPLSGYGIRGVCTGGTSGTPEEARYLSTEVLDGIQWIDTYGNTLVGHALQADLPGWNPMRSYHLVPPFGVLRVAGLGDWTTDAEPGQRGRIVATTLLRDLFIPNLLERDTALSMPPHPWFPWAGVADVQTVATAERDKPTEGVY
jgi:phenylacetate-coenzyme A ligase PaaK-like adenylate-forming protein